MCQKEKEKGKGKREGERGKGKYSWTIPETQLKHSPETQFCVADEG